MREGHQEQQLDYFAIKDREYGDTAEVPTNWDYFVLNPGHTSELRSIIPEVIDESELTLTDGAKISRPSIEALNKASLQNDEKYSSEERLNGVLLIFVQQLGQFSVRVDLDLIKKNADRSTSEKNDPFWERATKRLHALANRIRFIENQLEAINNFLEKRIRNQSISEETEIQLKLLDLASNYVVDLLDKLEKIKNIESINPEIIKEIEDIEGRYQNDYFRMRSDLLNVG